MSMSKTNWVCLFLLVLTIGGMIALNEYILDYTNGYYNAIDILFM